MAQDTPKKFDVQKFLDVVLICVTVAALVVVAVIYFRQPKLEMPNEDDVNFGYQVRLAEAQKEYIERYRLRAEDADKTKPHHPLWISASRNAPETCWICGMPRGKEHERFGWHDGPRDVPSRP